ncbi:HesA/MoeB/ThiF family protein [Pusillimonas noertemannii]|uniref:Molybdopterin/thiamine biosynthesis adenylyltransferase n=1 Tax=Pusillimonas noertemannii TaxID=305977 RepID=A0A2U1CN79_9BURK|nr:molybdopterin-synthase adenylyltransferase MoeB [Pusillimonas noertemannii]NYT68512.1 molybdopterin-synthase adenylyltransferase MoeB [Pusillimonas noertemannii]PVY62471.1 molybdopterin/thiamine biosynthesis adenylyltransferase [Pusillimonas noertemannii]TFL10572.1 molybdopterin-synthase adenylyltransferase MoeB [Pusillimonas noertemannii]
MNDQDLLRYARHILLNELGIEGQEKLLQARVLIIGAGGLGAPASLYLAGAGVGRITLADDDVVELSNLQRQIIHTTDRLDQAKAESGKLALHALNPSVQVDAVVRRLLGSELEDAVAQADVVLDCCDNFATRHAVNRACVLHRKPLVSGAAIRFAGQVSVYDMRDDASPCYHCLFPEADEADEVSCATTGVLGPLVGIIGSTQAAEAIKLITGMGKSLTGRLLCLDALTMQWSSIGLQRDPACPVCGHR